MEFIRLWRSYYSNRSRGLRKKAGTDDEIILDSITGFDLSMCSLLQWVLQYVGLQLKPIHNSRISIYPLRKSNFLSFYSSPQEVQAKYIALGIVPEYILKRVPRKLLQVRRALAAADLHRKRIRI